MKNPLGKILATLLIITLLISACQPQNHEPIGATGKHGMVVSAHPEATEIGLRVLQSGGNAMDAACAVELALAVCYPAAGNLGGGGFWVVYQPNGKVHTLDYRERAPQQASRNMFLDETGEVIPGLSTQSILSSGVPGTVAGLVMAHEKFGSLPWKRLVQPAIDLAQKGFPLTEAQANDFNRLKKDFLERNSWTVPFVHDTLWNEGDTLVQPDLAETLKRIRDEGKAGFYSGTTAQFLISQSEALQGLLSKTDLEAYEAKWREPITGTFRDLEFYSMAPPSSGGVALKQLLGLVEIIGDQFDGHNSPKTVHLMAECEKLVYADRADYLGDPDFVSVPVDHLTDPDYLKLRASLVKADTATPADQISAGAMPPEESQETTHFSIADKWGNAVAVTTTLNAGYGNKIVVRGAGFLLNNEMDDFSIKPGFPNLYGLVGKEANAIQPGKRMLSSMTPTILTQDGKLFMVVGSPGGSTIITSVFQTILNVVDHQMSMQEAVSAQRFHHQWLPDLIQHEPAAFDSLTMEQLRSKGHQFRQLNAIGRVDAILVHPDGTYEGGADPRGNDTAKGY